MAHAILSPSAASRWMACTPSARLEQQFPNHGSDYAMEGTLTHKLGELFLLDAKFDLPKEKFDKEFSKVKSHHLFQDEMIECAQEYADYVLEMCVEGTVLLVEQKLDMSNYVEKGFGTGDALVVNPATKCVDFIDYKHGKGVRVDATENKQTMLYALGALNDLGYIFDIEHVRMHIFQPRQDHVSVWEISVKDLIDWAEKELKPKAKLAYAGEGEFNPGKHCQFCKAKAQCRALRDYNMELVRMDFKDPNLLTDEEILEVLEKQDTLSGWIKAVGEYVLNSAMEGKKWKGYKVVESTSRRKYADEEKAGKALMKAGFKKSQLYAAPKLLGITAMEKLVTKPVFAKAAGPHVIKPQGKPTLVPESDKREEYNNARNDFA